MKFPQLPIGKRFAYQGQVYTKTGPLTARREADGTQRMIPRAALVAPADTGTSAAPGGADAGAGRGHPWSQALDAYEQVLRSALADRAPAASEGLESVLEAARQAFAEALRG
jgi:hypothetical protein